MADAEEILPWRARRIRQVAGFLTPAVRRAATALGIDARGMTGTGEGGRVTLADVLAGANAAPRGDETVPFNTVRKRAATLLVASKHTSAHTLAVRRADYTRIEQARAGAGLTALAFVARAVVDALHQFPLMNAAFDGHALVPHRAVNLGVAVDLNYEGLVVPVIRDADGLRLRALATSIRDVAAKARAKRLMPDDFAGGTFTITNPGASGTWISFPIINQPQVGILSTDGVSKQVLADDAGRLVIAPVGHLCLTFDHRALDGAYAGAFLDRVVEIVETRDWTAER
jgi:2-oxoglutarate dehydrogenase E2 component (dihydrolipoamide succinyltransferase)